MTLAPRDYIAERRREIAQAMERLKADLALLDRMEQAIGDGPLLSAIPIPADQAGPPAKPTPKPRKRVEGGIKGMVLFVLNLTGPMTAQQILYEIKHVYGMGLPRTTLSPQLSRLKQSGDVTVENAIWALTDKGRANAGS